MIIREFGRCEAAEIERVERSFNVHFPEVYKCFLHECNGGLIVPDGSESITAEGISEKIDIEAFFGIGVEENCFRLEYWMEQYQSELPEGAIIIGNDILKGFLIMLPVGDVVRFYYWDDERNFPMSTDESNAYDITNSFPGFEQIKEVSRNGVMEETAMKNDILPLGSIVILKNGVQKLLIIARAINVKNNNKQYFFDYGAVAYPDGLIGDQMAYFNADSVNKVVFEGYSDEADESMKDMIRQFTDSHPDILRGDPASWEA